MRGQESLKSCPYLSSTPRWTQPAPCSCPAVPIGSISVHLFSSSAFDTNLSIIYTNVNVSLQSRKVSRRTEDCLCVTTTARTHLFYLFIYHFNFSCVPPFSKMGGEGGEQVEVGWRKLVVRARLCLRHEKPREGCLPPWLSLLERESHSPLLLEDGKREEDYYYYCTINHREPRGRERERKETRRIIISMTRDNVQKITIGKKKRRRCWTVVVAAETSVAATAAADEFQRLRANFMAIVSFSFSSTAGWLLLPFQILTAAIYQVMHLWCLGAAATAACPFIFIMHLCGIRIYIYILLFFFLINPIVKWPFFPSCFFTLWILKEKHIERERKKSSQSPDNGYIYCYLVIVMNFPGEGTMGPKQKQREANGSVLCLLREWESVKRVQLNKPANEIDVPCRDN